MEMPAQWEGNFGLPFTSSTDSLDSSLLLLTKARLDGALSNLVKWKTAVGLELDDLSRPF